MLRAVLVLALCAAADTYTVTPAVALRHHAAPLPCAVVARRVAQPPQAVLGAGSARRQGASLLAATASPNVLQPARLALKTIVSALCSILAVSARALAADRLKSAPAAAAPLVLSGDMIKWGGLAAVFGVAYCFRKPETPILVETPVQDAAAATPTELAAAPVEPAGPSDDDMMADLRKRMMALDEDKQDEPPPTSEDGWGTGSTAVLEPPKPDGGLLDDGPVVDFPVGFPLVDPAAAEEAAPLEPEEPTASPEQIAMMERMFGTRSD